ncbi:hypothetical protein EAG_10305 [Camponotus floridanus]|uniref:Uncharacterized protein n=1 Tax=Camponotus floridanus TaxID=104421 RepID=E2ALZ7_CAMFO|nr:hypothetical protein EAG_10305 [Camponotus floridanus]
MTTSVKRTRLGNARAVSVRSAFINMQNQLRPGPTPPSPSFPVPAVATTDRVESPPRWPPRSKRSFNSAAFLHSLGNHRVPGVAGPPEPVFSVGGKGGPRLTEETVKIESLDGHANPPRRIIKTPQFRNSNSDPDGFRIHIYLISRPYYYDGMFVTARCPRGNCPSMCSAGATGGELLGSVSQAYPKLREFDTTTITQTKFQIFRTFTYQSQIVPWMPSNIQGLPWNLEKHREVLAKMEDYRGLHQEVSSMENTRTVDFIYDHILFVVLVNIFACVMQLLYVTNFWSVVYLHRDVSDGSPFTHGSPQGVFEALGTARVAILFMTSIKEKGQNLKTVTKTNTYKSVVSVTFGDASAGTCRSFPVSFYRYRAFPSIAIGDPVLSGTAFSKRGISLLAAVGERIDARISRTGPYAMLGPVSRLMAGINKEDLQYFQQCYAENKIRNIFTHDCENSHDQFSFQLLKEELMKNFRRLIQSIKVISVYDGSNSGFSISRMHGAGSETDVDSRISDKIETFRQPIKGMPPSSAVP